MIETEKIQPGATVRGIVPDGLVTAVNAQWFGPDALVQSWPEIVRLAREAPQATGEQGGLFS